MNLPGSHTEQGNTTELTLPSRLLPTTVIQLQGVLVPCVPTVLSKHSSTKLTIPDSSWLHVPNTAASQVSVRTYLPTDGVKRTPPNRFQHLIRTRANTSRHRINGANMLMHRCTPSNCWSDAKTGPRAVTDCAIQHCLPCNIGGGGP
jgi:hypothetical protein